MLSFPTFIALPTSFSVCLSLCLSLSACLSLCQSLYLPVFLSACLYLCLSFSLPVLISACFSLCLSFSLSVFLSSCLSLSLSVSLCHSLVRVCVMLVYFENILNVTNVTQKKKCIMYLLCHQIEGRYNKEGGLVFLLQKHKLGVFNRWDQCTIWGTKQFKIIAISC